MPVFKRAHILTVTIPFLLGLTGLLFFVFEDVNEGTFKDETDFIDYLWISSVASLIGWIFTIFIDFVAYKCWNDD